MMTEERVGFWRSRAGYLTLIGIVAAGAAGATALLTNIFERKAEQRVPYVRLVEVGEDDTDPAKWGRNWPAQYDGYKRTALTTKTRFGGHQGSEAMPEEKIEREPWLKRIFLGYAFSLDYRDRRGHAYMLYDQEHTERVTKKQQPGACLHCHASIIPAYRFTGDGNIQKGFEAVSAMPYQQAHDLVDKTGKRLVDHPVGCVDCHEPKSMKLRVTRPAFMTAIAELKATEGIKDFDVNRDATHQEMRTFACAQCHVEYYFKGEKKTVTYPWKNGLKVEQIEQYYDEAGFTDYKHGETGAPILKAQHPEFETWSQGIHARS